MPVGEIVDLPMELMLNNNFESVKIPSGLLVKVFTDDGFQGRFTWITTDTADLGDFNDVITSIIVAVSASILIPIIREHHTVQNQERHVISGNQET